jgi:hypothetical protein
MRAEESGATGDQRAFLGLRGCCVLAVHIASFVAAACGQET